MIRVLLVEDNESCATAARILLQMLGFEVMRVSNGEEALSAVSEFKPNAIILDLHMPVMDGREFLRRYQGPIPIIIVSGWSDMKHLPRQPYAKVLKPTSMKIVAGIIREAVEETTGA